MDKKMLFIRPLLAIAVLLVAGYSRPSYADRCNYRSGQGAVNMTIPLVTANISVGADVAVNTVIHQQYVGSTETKAPWLDCGLDAPSTRFQVNQYLKLINVPALVAG